MSTNDEKTLVIVHDRKNDRECIASWVRRGLEALRPEAAVTVAAHATMEPAQLKGYSRVICAVLHEGLDTYVTLVEVCQRSEIPVLAVSGGGAIPFRAGDGWAMFLSKADSRYRNIPPWLQHWYSQSRGSFSARSFRSAVRLLETGTLIPTRVLLSLQAVLYPLVPVDITAQRLLRIASPSHTRLTRLEAPLAIFPPGVARHVAGFSPFDEKSSEIVTEFLRCVADQGRFAEPKLDALRAVPENALFQLWSSLASSALDCPRRDGDTSISVDRATEWPRRALSLELCSKAHEAFCDSLQRIRRYCTPLDSGSSS